MHTVVSEIECAAASDLARVDRGQVRKGRMEVTRTSPFARKQGRFLLGQRDKLCEVRAREVGLARWTPRRFRHELDKRDLRSTSSSSGKAREARQSV